MNRAEFEHVVRAAADVVDDDIVVIGSQAILAQHPDAPPELLRSAELDVFPRTKLEAADDIDGALGEREFVTAAVGPAWSTPNNWFSVSTSCRRVSATPSAND